MSQTAPGASLEHLRDLVESAIESHDVGPLVKAVFEVEAGEAGAGLPGTAGAGGAPPTPPLPAPPGRADGGESATTRDSDAVPAGGALERVLELLGEVAEDKEAEIAQICRSNAAEIAGAMHELGAMQRQTADLRRQLLASNATLQAAGTAFAGRLEEVQEAVALQQGVAEARQAVGSALQVLQLCAKAAQLIEGKQLYKAYKTLEAIQRDHAAVLQGGGSSGYSAAPLLSAGAAARPAAPAATAGGTAGSREGTPHKAGTPGAAAGTPGGGAAAGAAAAAVAQRPGSGGGRAQLGPLAGFLRARVAELTAALEQRAIADFHNWLTSVRAQARTIGLRAVRWAASERQQEEQLARQRKLLLPHLEALTDVRAAGQLAAQSLQDPGVAEVAPPTPLEPPPAVGTPAAAAATSPRRGAGSPGGGSTPSAARTASFRAARQAASSPTRAAAAAAGPAAGSPADSPRSAASSNKAAAAGAVQTPPPAQARGLSRAETFAVTGDLLDNIDMTPLHRCLHIHACLGRLPQFTEYYIQNRRQQLATDLTLSGDFLEHYQAYLTQLVGYFLVEDAVARTAGWAGAAGAEGHLDIVAQVDAAWDAAVAALKAVLEPAFRGATAAAAMLTVKDFLLLVCLALDHCGYHTVAVKEVLMAGRAKYQDLLGAATAAAVQAAVAGDSLAVSVEVDSAARAQELFGQLALPPTFRPEDASNKKPPFRAPFTAMVPRLARIIRGHIVDTVAYLKGLLTAGEVVPATRQYRDRMLSRIVADCLQKRVDAAVGQADLPVETALQLVANVAALMHALAPLDDFALAQARGETPEIAAAAAAAAAASASSRSPSPGPRSRSRSPVKLAAGGEGEAEPRGRQQLQGVGVGGGERGGRSRSGSPTSSHGSAPSPSPPSSPRAAAGEGPTADAQQVASQQASQQASRQAQQQPAGSQQSGHTVLSFSAAGATASSRGSPRGAAGSAASAAGSAAATLAGLLGSAEALAVQAVAARAAELLAAGEQLDWAPAEQQRSTAYSEYMEELILYLKEVASLAARMAPAPSVERMLRAVLRYLADAVMLQLMSDVIPEYNIFGLQRLYSDLGGISRAAGSMGVPGLPDELAEPMLFCEMMVFGSLEELLQPEQRPGVAGGKYAALDLRRVCLVLDKYQELDRASGFAGMHKKGQAERFISRRTVDRVLRELRERERSRSPSRASSSAGSFSAGAADAARRSSSVGGSGRGG
ncbi:hypothetical protein ABPG75_005938 [Micractinium tetrahymenae]